MKIIAASLVLLSSLAVASPVGAQSTPNLIVNGGFEQPFLPTAGIALFNTFANLNGWTVWGKAGNVAVVNGAYAHGGITFQAATGRNWLDLTGGTNVQSAVKQTIRTTPGKTYRVAFKVGNVVDRVGPYGLTSTVRVAIDGVTAYTAVNRDGNATAMTWKSYSFDFVAKQPRTAISFINMDARADNANGLDMVVVKEVATSAR